ncbi:hypothetical protein QT381_13455 [Galbitalea sp. SE-J8]|uniref:FKBP-type peptidyl-prolyl cis-trans isomerase n=1 Tax=Galbitalea sp. SE-J8 TaxID=3054952 RepID=UPI00259CF4C6|nr:hypothetical protein [Galbitalea sp. SE-J8]MDM4764016.1 hypothetical protein [Galbitalea sp. SE-J8]
MRSIAALTAAAVVAISLTACSSAGSAGDCTPTASGAASSTITATGDFGGTSTTAEYPTPLLSKRVQVSVLAKGTGAIVEPGDYADFVATQYDSTTGAVTYPAQKARFGASDASDLNRIFECVTVGSRLAAVVPTGETAKDPSTAVLVIDVLDRIPGRATGRDELPVNGLPAVVTAPNGTPGITVPSAPAPTTVRSAVLKQGDGATVKRDATVVLHYSEFTWDQPAHEVGSSWTAAAPSSYAAKDFDSSDGSGLWPGTEKAIVGQQVGSQVIVVVPPKDSYASDAPDSVAEGSTRIYVIDILGIQPTN